MDLCDGLTMLSCFLLLSRFLILDYNDGRMTLHCRCLCQLKLMGNNHPDVYLSICIYKRQWWQKHCHISFCVTNTGFISSLWEQHLVSIINNSHKPCQWKGQSSVSLVKTQCSYEILQLPTNCIQLYLLKTLRKTS